MKYDSPYIPGSPATNLNSPVTFTTAITGPGEAYMLIPTLSQSSQSNSRIGDYIQPRKLIVDLRASLILPSALDTRFGPEVYPEDIMVHIFFLTSKKIKDASLVSNIDFTELMGYDGHATGAFDGTMHQADKPVNKEDFTVLKRLVFRLKRPAGYPSLVQNVGIGLPTPPTITPFYGNGGQDTKRFKVRIPLPKRLQFKEPGTVYPENYFPFMVAGWTYTHAPTDQTVSNLSPLAITANTQMFYTDD